ncbi:GntR family transcriptional regulator [Nocardioides albus]|uniref:DNA-binding GntR family transcriptional regulator n=1 Tax=Nocardioides albus TaxID=1841 RepID=A0A7W5AA79_9ACTN|nr:GntR family transcriptional regulator [Nocardioides albus]MBB3092325.1 DNA-binding GntR family transcriptional regulator [Nocardioides albus]GGU47171.1 GntR family transcriptional regulator [Nocardioides albus]
MTTDQQRIQELFDDPDAKPLVVGTGERVADLLRSYLTEGRILPGTRMSEEAFARALSVSRNTLREAFRLLAHEGLLVHKFNRGVFVRELTSADISDIYQFRKMVELGAIRQHRSHTPTRLHAVRLAVTNGLVAAEQDDWRAVGTANMNFHMAITALAGNDRMNATMRQLLAEMRLAFVLMQPIKDFHSPHLALNVEICELLERGNWTAAADRLDAYLDTACQQLLTAFDRAAGQ